jgi:hypothetical protein
MEEFNFNYSKLSQAKTLSTCFLKEDFFPFFKKHLVEHHVLPWEHIAFFLEECGFEILEYACIDISNSKIEIQFKDMFKRKINNSRKKKPKSNSELVIVAKEK